MATKSTVRHTRRFLPQAEPCEGRLLLSAAHVHIAGTGVLLLPGGEAHPVRPNTPVLPYGAAASVATFIDPTTRIHDGNRISLGAKTYVAPFAGLDATDGYIRIGQNSAILDNALIQSNAKRTLNVLGVSIGERVVIGYGARVFGPSKIGDFGVLSAPTEIGPNAVVDGATIAPGAIVGAGAVIQPGITIPRGIRVLPRAVVTTAAEATDPRLGKVVLATATDLAAISTELSTSTALAAGYATLYQGQAATGPAGSPVASTTTPNLFNGDLSTVMGTSQEPGSPAVSFEPSRRGPVFSGPKGRLFEGNFRAFPARIIGGVIFHQSARRLQHNIGKNVSIRGDEGQPIVIGSIAHLDRSVTIHAVRGGTLTIGNNFRAGTGAVILGGAGSTIGDGVTVGSGAVVTNSKLGSGVQIGDGAYVAGSTLAPGTIIPAGTVLINGVRS
ncbi:MAG: bifunctional N-acetylglucosamine-phosphate uridyltransferase/glucosamine-phosphate [Planctomycetota bacterium]|nr:bifunctional N-acetylglucosamine-phosphate uridyltransferase/glucosamine-phosphate [Planctomycetota bacterium]